MPLPTQAAHRLSALLCAAFFLPSVATAQASAQAVQSGEAESEGLDLSQHGERACSE